MIDCLEPRFHSPFGARVHQQIAEFRAFVVRCAVVLAAAGIKRVRYIDGLSGGLWIRLRIVRAIFESKLMNDGLRQDRRLAELEF